MWVPLLLSFTVLAAALLWLLDRGPLDVGCVSRSTSGWLVAENAEALVRIEWGPGEGRLGVGPARTQALTWSPLSGEDARRRARQVIAPLGHPLWIGTSFSLGAAGLKVALACDEAVTRFEFFDRAFGSKPFITKPPLTPQERLLRSSAEGTSARILVEARRAGWPWGY